MILYCWYLSKQFLSLFNFHLRIFCHWCLSLFYIDLRINHLYYFLSYSLVFDCLSCMMNTNHQNLFLVPFNLTLPHFTFISLSYKNYYLNLQLNFKFSDHSFYLEFPFSKYSSLKQLTDCVLNLNSEYTPYFHTNLATASFLIVLSLMC